MTEMLQLFSLKRVVFIIFDKTILHKRTRKSSFYYSHSSRNCIIDCLDFCIKNKGITVYGYVILSNHIHLIIHSKDGKLSDLIRDFKKFTAKTILEKIQAEPESRRDWMLERFKIATESHSRNKNYQFWQYGNHADIRRYYIFHQLL